MSSTFIIILISFLITSCVSGLLGLAAWLLGSSFYAWFLIGYVVQYILGWFWNILSSKILRTKIQHADALQKIATVSSEREFNCAYCHTANVVPLLLNQENHFTCQSCKQDNNIQIDFVVMRTTEPLYADDVLKDIFDKIDPEKIEKIANAEKDVK